MKELFSYLKAWMLRHYKLLAVVGLVLFLLAVAPTVYAVAATNSSRYDAQSLNRVPYRRVAIIFGAGVMPDGTPTDYLKSRIQVGVELYSAGRVQKLLMTGDNSQEHYNEPQAMKRYAVSLGVKSEDVVMDYAGFNTYDSCYRAREVFGIEQAILVTHGYHLPRAVMTCSNLGVKSIGVSTHGARFGRDYGVMYLVREVVSNNKAVVQLLLRPKPRLLGQPEVM